MLLLQGVWVGSLLGGTKIPHTMRHGQTHMGFTSGSAVKNLPTTQEMHKNRIRSLDREDLLEEAMETHASILA